MEEQGVDLKELKRDVNVILSKLMQINVTNVTKELFIQESTSDIQYLLRRLKLFLIQKEDLDDCLDKLPETGQLLGRLCASQVVRRSDDDLYKLVMECVVIFYKQNGTTQLETRAKEWAVTQLHGTVSLPDIFPSCSLGLSKSAVIKQYVSQMLQKVKEKLENILKTGRKWCVDIGYLPCEILPYDLLNEVMDLLLCVMCNEEFHSVWEDLLYIMSQCNPKDGIVLEFYERITQCFKDCYDSETSKLILSAKGFELLWTSYLPSLESEVLSMCETACRYCLPSSIEAVIKRSCLVDVCSCNATVYMTVCQMLHTCIRQSGGNPKLVRVAAVFSKCILNCGWLSKQQHMVKTDPCALTSLATLLLQYLLTVPPVTLSIPLEARPDDKAVFLSKISNYFDSLNEEDYAFFNYMVYHHSLYILLIKTSLHCDNKLVGGCINLLSHLCHPLERESYASLKNILMRLVMALRSLMHKIHLGYQDLLYVMTVYVQPTDETKALIGQFIMAFLYSVVAGMDIFRQVLSQIPFCDGDYSQLSCIMIAHEELDVDFTKCSPYWLKEYKHFIKELLSSSQLSLKYSDIVAAAERFVS